MAEINHIITLGIGTPASIPMFITLGLMPAATGLFDLDARPRLGDFDTDERVSQVARKRSFNLDMDGRDD